MMTGLIRAARCVSRSRPIALALGLAVIGALAACASDPAARYRGNLTPEMATLGNNYPQIHNKSAVMLDANWSLFLEDWARMGLWDRPSRLTRKPMPH